MITTTSKSKPSEVLKLPPLTSINSLTVAAALFFSDGAILDRSSAAESRQAPASLDTSSRVLYSISDLERLESFSKLLSANANLLSSIKARDTVFNFVVADGVLDAIPLHPLERRALELLRDNDVDTVRFAIIQTRTHLIKGTFSEKDMFGGHRASNDNTEPSSRDLPPDIATDYGKLLGVCQFLTGTLALKSGASSPSLEEKFLSSLPPQRETTLIQTLGALILSERLSPATYASQFGEHILIAKANSITPEEIENIPLLKKTDHYASHPWLLRAFILSQVTLLYGLFKAATHRARETNVERIVPEEK